MRQVNAWIFIAILIVVRDTTMRCLWKQCEGETASVKGFKIIMHSRPARHCIRSLYKVQLKLLYKLLNLVYDLCAQGSERARFMTICWTFASVSSFCVYTFIGIREPQLCRWLIKMCCQDYYYYRVSWLLNFFVLNLRRLRGICWVV